MTDISKSSINPLIFGLTLTTVIIWTSGVSDPVNAPKMLILGITGSVALFLYVIPSLGYLLLNQRVVTLSSFIMIASMAAAALQSQSPLSQNIYGVQGRNTGFLTYLAFIFIFLAVLTFRNLEDVIWILKALIICGWINLIYCAWVICFGDFVGWNNQYGSILGTFGNPNFISSFLGLFVVALASHISFNRKSFLSIFAIIIALFEIFKSNSTQGFVLIVVGISVVCFFRIHFYIRRFWISTSILFLFAIAVIFLILAILNRGPLASIVYQNTLGYRREYWVAGVKMGLKFPLYGVGLDSYGDWYRTLRTPKSIISPGLNVITNVAHNIYIDIFATGGFIFLITYAVPTITSVATIIRMTKKLETYDALFVGLTSTWICYQAQSLISISQIGLAIWGWVITAAILAYGRCNKIDDYSLTKIPKKKLATYNKLNYQLPIRVIIGTVLGFLLFSPPFLADRAWTTAYISRDANKLYDSLNSNYFNPENSFILAQAAVIFQQNNMPDKSYELAKRATTFNSLSFDAWKILYSSPFATTSEKDAALAKMYELNPLDKSILKLQNSE